MTACPKYDGEQLRNYCFQLFNFYCDYLCSIYLLCFLSMGSETNSETICFFPRGETV